MRDPVLQTVPLGFQWPTVDPFLFCVHHDDAYPAGNGAFGPAASLAGRDLGQEVAPVLPGRPAVDAAAQPPDVAVEFEEVF